MVHEGVGRAARAGGVVIGIGIDVCPVREVATALHEHPTRYPARVLSPRELRTMPVEATPPSAAGCDPQEQARRLAAAFAVKEAVTKALRPTPAQSWRLSWIEVGLPTPHTGSGDGRVDVQLHSGAAALAALRGVSRIDAVVEHAPLHSSHAMAVATAVAH